MSSKSVVRLSDLLDARAPTGAPVRLLLDSWAEVEDAVRADAGDTREALNAAAEALPPVAGAIADRRTLATAVLNPRGDVFYADAAYLALFPDSADLRPLLKRARREAPLVSLVDGAAGAAFVAWVGDAAAAARWPLDPEATAALRASPERLVVVVSAPSRSSELARRAAQALDLTALEARLAEALLFAPNLDVAAADAGVGRETARDALRRINAKLGVRRTPELISRLVGLMCAAQSQQAGGDPTDDEAVAQHALNLTPAEARAAALVARGATAPEAAKALGLSAETIKTHMKSVLAKTGAHSAKDLARLLAEARELVALTSAAEPVFAEEEGGGRLRILPSLDGDRRIALIDYGPYDGEPVFVFHGAAAGRRLPEGLRSRLAAAGLRALVLQRPGFGLTDPARGDYVETGAADMAAAVERLRLRSAHLLGRDTGTPVALAFAAAYPERLGRAALLNPQPPMRLAPDRDNFTGSVQKHLLRNPDLVAAFAEFLRRQATTQLLERILARMLGEAACDAQALSDPAVRRFLIRDIQALCARSAHGFAAEHAVYANGWEAPRDLPARGWTVAISAGFPNQVDPSWLGLRDLKLVELAGAGMLPQFTHAAELAALLTG
ncbi:MAG: alpha/beta hydrolase [Phenylobacterium sp.]|uniref:alpha/beta hydrolase n=1 Tax=Phenylobacterium sp. TaxID=1871053 RepID=UPI001A3ECE83|nr:alpha/beta hydrolase [Phenylobacterium sp.]MBL8772293.1 alpha/beta hydrolase [Phenylobacterium sp.]